MTYQEWLKMKSGGNDTAAIGEGLSNPDGLPSLEAQRFGKSLGKDALQGALTGQLNPFGSFADAAYSSLGIGQDKKGAGAVIGGGVNALTRIGAMGLGMVNPAAGLLLGLAATPIADAVGDFTGLRDYDLARDQLEDELGEIGGRQAYANAMPEGVQDLSTLEGRSFQEAADLVGPQTQIGGPERRSDFAKQQTFYQQLADNITQSVRDRQAQEAGLSGGAYSYGDATSYYGGGDSSMGGHNVGGAQGTSTGTGGGFNTGGGGVTGL